MSMFCIFVADNIPVCDRLFLHDSIYDRCCRRISSPELGTFHSFINLLISVLVISVKM